MLRSVLLAVDLLPGSKRVLERAAALPLAPDATVTLLHVVPAALPAAVRRQAREDALEALETAAARLARATGATVEAFVAEGDADEVITARARRVGAELLVVGRVGARSVRELFIGSTAERVVRRGAGPTLVVRLPTRGPYARPLLALDDDEVATGAVRAALALLPQPPPALRVLHAYEAPLEGLAYPRLDVGDARAYREAFRKAALARIHAHLEAARRRAPGELELRVTAEHGAPRTVIPHGVAFHRADLLVLGTRAAGGLARAFLGTVAGDVLREVQCDVLVVPPPRRAR